MGNWKTETEAREMIKALVTDYYHDFKEKKEEFDELLKKSTLPEHLDYDEINNLLIESRKKFYNF